MSGSVLLLASSMMAKDKQPKKKKYQEVENRENPFMFLKYQQVGVSNGAHLSIPF